uniref:Evasin n=1 Tax=Amblyomma parvum TaxID=251391 RepID=A0A023G0A2_AMBPA
MSPRVAFFGTCLSIILGCTAQPIRTLEGFESYEYPDFNYSYIDLYTPRTPTASEEDGAISGEGPDVCLADGMNTEKGTVPVGCSMQCMKNGTLPLKNDTLCIACTPKALEDMQPYYNYTCPLGVCMGGFCESCNRSTWCWRPQITSMVVAAD